ncbi:MAG: histidine--tRNA ligase [Candidatus Brennerbacteria bacterium]
MAKEKKIVPELSSGFRDYLPEDMIPRQQMFDTIRAVFERFGFVPLDTPGLEKEEILTGGDENFRMHIFRTDVQVGWDKLALRFDLTVPLARVIAQYQNEIKRPFKRYQVGKVWRAEKPQAGRFREFVQFDADIVGAASMMADAEIIALMYETMKALGVPNFFIRVNTRKILNGLAAFAGFQSEKTAAVLRTIDKLDKQGWEAVYAELSDATSPEGLALSENAIAKLKEFLEVRGENQEATIQAVRTLMQGVPIVEEGVQDLEKILEGVRAMGVPDDVWAIELSVARGLGYYTGPVFETVLKDLPSIGSVFSGGRYDDLVERFGTINVPATGASVGVDRLFTALEELGLVKRRKSVSQVAILNFDPESGAYIQGIAAGLRRGNIPTEIYLGNEATLKGQLAYVLNADIPVVIIAGSDERERNAVQVKDLRARKQVEVSRNQLLSHIRTILEV